MKAICLAGGLVSLSCVAAEQKLQELTVKNNSSQDVTVHYQREYAQYVIIEALSSKSFKLTLPQELTIHFKQLNFQQPMTVNSHHEPLLIQQYSTIAISQNGAMLVPEMYFHHHSPSLTIHQNKMAD